MIIVKVKLTLGTIGYQQKLESYYFSEKNPNSLVQFVYFLIDLDFRNIQDYKEFEAYLPHRMEETLQQLRAKKYTSEQ